MRQQRQNGASRARTFLEVPDVPGGEGDAGPVLHLRHAALEPSLAGLHRRRVRHFRRRHFCRGRRGGGRGLGLRFVASWGQEGTWRREVNGKLGY
jgi:hypothetical protein